MNLHNPTFECYKTMSRFDEIEAKIDAIATTPKMKLARQERKHILKMRTEGGKWYVDEDYKVSIFENSTDAWQYIFVLKAIRPQPPFVPRSLYPVRTLDPTRVRGCKQIVRC